MVNVAITTAATPQVQLISAICAAPGNPESVRSNGTPGDLKGLNFGCPQKHHETIPSSCNDKLPAGASDLALYTLEQKGCHKMPQNLGFKFVAFWKMYRWHFPQDVATCCTSDPHIFVCTVVDQSSRPWMSRQKWQYYFLKCQESRHRIRSSSDPPPDPCEDECISSKQLVYILQAKWTTRHFKCCWQF